MNTQFHQEIPLERRPQGLLGKIIAFLLSAALLIVGLMFSVFALAAVAVIGASLGGWLWWKTRAVRKQMRQMEQEFQAQASQTSANPSRSKDIIEGEFVREPGSNQQLLR